MIEKHDIRTTLGRVANLALHLALQFVVFFLFIAQVSRIFDALFSYQLENFMIHFLVIIFMVAFYFLIYRKFTLKVSTSWLVVGMLSIIFNTVFLPFVLLHLISGISKGSYDPILPIIHQYLCILLFFPLVFYLLAFLNKGLYYLFAKISIWITAIPFLIIYIQESF